MRVFFILILGSVLLGDLEGYRHGGRKYKGSKGGMTWHHAASVEECGKAETIHEGYPKEVCDNLKKDDKLCLCMSIGSENWNFVCGECSMRWVGNIRDLFKKKRNLKKQKDEGTEDTVEEKSGRLGASKANRASRGKKGKKGGNQERLQNRQKLRQKIKQKEGGRRNKYRGGPRPTEVSTGGTTENQSGPVKSPRNGKHRNGWKGSQGRYREGGRRNPGRGQYNQRYYQAGRGPNEVPVVEPEEATKLNQPDAPGSGGGSPGINTTLIPNKPVDDLTAVPESSPKPAPKPLQRPTRSPQPPQRPTQRLTRPTQPTQRPTQPTQKPTSKRRRRRDAK